MARKRRRPTPRRESADSREIRKLLLWMVGVLLAALLGLLKLCHDK